MFAKRLAAASRMQVQPIDLHRHAIVRSFCKPTVDMDQMQIDDGDTKYLYRMRNTKLMMLEGDLQAIADRLSILTTTDFSTFLKS